MSYARRVWTASGGNPLYLSDLLRVIELDKSALARLDPAGLVVAGLEGIAPRVVARVRGLDPRALGLAQALAVLGDGCALRHAAAIAEVELAEAARLAVGLARLEVLASDDPPRFIHPVVRDAVEASLGSDERGAMHRAAARLLHADGAPAGQVAAHLVGVLPAGDRWVLARLREAARAAMESGAPRAAADLLGRALAEPPPPAVRVDVLRETARAEASAGRETAWGHLEEALRLVADPRERAETALEVAEAYAALFRWVDAVDVLERALAELAELGDADETLAARLEGELVVCGLHDARRASRVSPSLERLAARRLEAPSEALAVAQGMATFLTGGAADEIALPLERALARAGAAVENWDTRAALLWVLVATERFDTVEAALEPLLAEVHRSGSARGLVAAYSTLGLLKLRLGALPEADAAARTALRVLQEGDFAPGLAFAATVRADVGVEAGEPEEAQALLDLLPQEGWPPGVGTVLIPAARGRLRLAQGRPAEAFADFETCLSLFGADAWGMEIRETGYVHARSGAALALLRLGQRTRACELADAELADVRVLGTPRALGIALRVAGLARGGGTGLQLLGESVAVLQGSPALLERAHSLAALGAAATPGRRTRRRTRPSRPGARPRRALRRQTTGGPRARGAQGNRRPPSTPVAHRRGSAHPQRASRRPAGGRGPLQSRDRLRALRDAQDHRGAPRARLHQARHRGPGPAGRGPRRRKDQGPNPVAKHAPPPRSSGPYQPADQEAPMATTTLDAFEQGTNTFNAHDLDGFAEVLADDVVFSAPGGMQGEGKAACLEFYGGWIEAFPDAHVEVTALHVIDDVAVEEGAFTGTHKGVLHTPAGDLPPTGRAVKLDYIQVLRFRDGTHVSFNLTFDRLTMLEQLGLVPSLAESS